MSTSILFSDAPEHFYGQLRECIQQVIQQELSTLKKEDTDVYLKEHEVCKMLRIFFDKFFWFAAIFHVFAALAKTREVHEILLFHQRDTSITNCNC
jgi:elongation factor P hydroxylase